MATDFYHLPLSLKSCELVVSSDLRYLNQSYSPIINPLSKPLNIVLYNEKWFDKLSRISQPLFDYNHPTFSFPEPQLTPFTSLLDLHTKVDTISSSPLIEKSDTDIHSPPFPFVISKSLSISNGLFFIRYVREDTFKQRWLLVKIIHEETTILNMQPETTSDYHVTFLERHPTDKNLCDDKTR